MGCFSLGVRCWWWLGSWVRVQMELEQEVKSERSTVIDAIPNQASQFPPLRCESIVNPQKLILQSFRVKSLGSNARFKNLCALPNTMSCINMQIIFTQKAQKVDSIDQKKLFFVEFLFLSSGFKVSHCFVGDYRIVSSTFSNMINYVQSKVLKVFQNFRYFSHHHLWTNLHPFKCVFCVILFCFTLLCVPYVLCIPLNCFYFSVSFQFLIVPCVYLWILKVSFFLFSLFLFLFYVVIFFCAPLCDASIKSYRVFELALLETHSGTCGMD